MIGHLVGDINCDPVSVKEIQKAYARVAKRKEGSCKGHFD
jgi:hypothetical protein